MPDANEFIQQILPQLFPIFLIFFVLMGVAVFFLYIRPTQRKKKIEKSRIAELEAELNLYKSGQYGLVDIPDTAELPDLDQLLSFSDEPVSRITKQSEVTHSFGQQVYQMTLDTGQEVAAKELIRILKNRDDDRYIVQMASGVYQSFVNKREVKQEFAAVMKDLQESVSQADAPVTESSVIEPEFAREPEVKKPSSVTLKDLAETPMIPKPQYGDTEIPGDLPSYKLDDISPTREKGLLGRTKVVYEDLPELNLAKAIEAYLQFRLHQTDLFAGRHIHIHPSNEGGIKIQVDKDYYEMVHDVEDEQVKNFIQQCIQEWQERL